MIKRFDTTNGEGRAMREGDSHVWQLSCGYWVKYSDTRILIDALEQYAMRDFWEHTVTDENTGVSMTFTASGALQDGGEIARQALKEIGQDD